MGVSNSGFRFATCLNGAVTENARMKLSGHIANSDINLRIKSLLFDVGLISALNEKIGSDNDKILSAGEKKRLVFAAELISDPSILFLDEPTTGQDAYTASILVKQLHSFAAQGRTVLCTIHQPSSEVFNSFKKIILLANGRIAYTGTSTGALNFFSSLGYVCPHLYNPADFLIGTLVSNPNESFNITTAQRICDSFLSSDSSKKIDLILQSEIHRTRTVKNMLIETGNQPGELLFRQKILWMIHREILHILRDPSVQIWRIIQKIVSTI
ncbi:protein scarlet-like [Nasonia vitripennis]|uniref:Uncharacterized protein n=1 Tax=Nasonia vitripennis TaxID=7425 RepID=A0A7M7QJP1_NASVI|nr:protein scarlet-like [Nasonia vitripennis]